MSDISEHLKILIRNPHLLSEDDIKSFETEVDKIIQNIAKQTFVNQRYEELSKAIHLVAKKNPNLKHIDESFQRVIKKVSENQPLRPVRDNPINKVQLNAWIEAHKDPIIISALKILIDTIRHVSQKEFEESLIKTTNQLNALLDQEGGEYVIAIEKGKSNQWVAQLALPYLTKQPIDEISLIFANYLSEYKKNYSSSSIKLPKHIVFFDDAAYSGEQLSRILKQMIYSINLHHSRNKKEPLIMPKFIIAVPYMTNFAADAIRTSLKNLRFEINGEIHSGIEYLEILPYNRIMTVSELIPNKKVIHVLNQLWWPFEAHLEKIQARRPLFAKNQQFVKEQSLTKDLSPSQFAHKKGSESRGTTYFSFKIPDEDSFLGPLAEGKVIIGGSVLHPEKEFEIIPRTVPPYKPNFAQFCSEIKYD